MEKRKVSSMMKTDNIVLALQDEYLFVIELVVYLT